MFRGLIMPKNLAVPKIMPIFAAEIDRRNRKQNSDIVKKMSEFSFLLSHYINKKT